MMKTSEILLFAILLAALAPVAIWRAAQLLWNYLRAIASGYDVGNQPDTAEVLQPPHRRTDDREPAYSHYLFGQAWRDLRHAHWLGLRSLGRTVASGWTKILEKNFQPSSNPKPGSIARGVYKIGALGVGTLLAAPILLALTISQVLVLGLLFVASIGMLYLLRVFDTTVLWLRGATTTCRHCGRRITFAEYSCRNPACDIRHRDVRPGRYGMIFRRCYCGEKFPTMVAFGSYKLEGWCPSCDKPLTRISPEIILPMFGAVNAGKTQLIIVLTIAVETAVGRTGGTFDYANDSVRALATKAISEFLATKEVRKIGQARAPTAHPAYSIYVAPKKSRTKLLHIFDAAGEVFTNAKLIQELEYLKIARTFVFVIDPLSIGKLWCTIDPAQRETLKHHRAQQEPYTTFAETVQTVKKMGINTSKINLVVAVSKMDLIENLLHEKNVRDDRSIKRWLDADLAQGHLIRAMDHDFKNVSFFLTAALANGHNRAHPTVERFIKRTLAVEGLRLT